MMFNLNDFLNRISGGATRVTSDVGPISPVILQDGDNFDPLNPLKGNEIEQGVVSRIISLASDVRFVIDKPELFTYKDFEKRLEPSLVFADSIKRMVYISLVHKVLSLVFIRNGGKVREIKSFHTFQDADQKGNLQFTDYIEKDRHYVVPQRDIAQFSRYPDNIHHQPVNLRKAEIEYWTRWQKLNKLTGTLNTQDRKLSDMYSSENKEGVLAIKNIGDVFSQSNIAFIPKDHEFKQVPLMAGELNRLRENLVESYCFHYGFPSPLFYINLTTHNQLTLSAALKEFKLTTLTPILNPIAEAIGAYLGASVVVDYSALTLSSAKEILEISQSGVKTINEIRKDLGLPPVEGGEQMPQAAGAPSNENISNQVDNGSRNHE